MMYVMGLFRTASDAAAAIRELKTAGFTDRNTGLMSRRHEGQDESWWESIKDFFTGGDTADSPGIGRSYVGGPFSGSGSLLTKLKALNVPDEQAHAYAEGVRRGHTLIAAKVEDSDVDQVAEIMDRHHLVNVHALGEHWRSEGWSRFDESSEPYGHEKVREHRDYLGSDEGKQKLEEIEERLEVGKRRVERGHIRAYTHVTERPVEETVELRKEEVHVNRERVDRPATDADFTEREIEVTETDEEAVVSKKAHVTEEVTLDKDVKVNKEVIRDTLRKQEVEVETDEGVTTGGKTSGTKTRR